MFLWVQNLTGVAPALWLRTNVKEFRVALEAVLNCPTIMIFQKVGNNN